MRSGRIPWGEVTNHSPGQRPDDGAEELVRHAESLRPPSDVTFRKHGLEFYALNVQRTSVWASGGYSRTTGYAARVIPWIVLAVVVVPLVIAGFVVTRRSTVAREHPASEDAQARARTEQEFAEAEAYEEKWREKDKERYRQERFP
jgi:uncharacterized membrane protein